MQTEQELSKRLFKDNDALLQSIRALFFGLPLSDTDKKLLKDTFASEEVRKMFWNRFLPELSKDTPISLVNDVWIGVEKNIFGQSRDTIRQAVDSKALAIEMTRKALTLMDNIDGEAPNIVYDPSGVLIDDTLQIFLLARNSFLQSTENQLTYLKVMANMTGEETPQQTAKRLTKDSVR